MLVGWLILKIRTRACREDFVFLGILIKRDFHGCVIYVLQVPTQWGNELFVNVKFPYLYQHFLKYLLALKGLDDLRWLTPRFTFCVQEFVLICPHFQIQN